MGPLQRIRQDNRRAWALISMTALVLLTTAVNSRAGGGPHNVLVVVNDRSIESLELGQFYQEQREIPERNICHVSAAFPTQNVAVSVFQTDIVDSITAHIDTHGLSQQIDYVVLCKGVPSRVADAEGATAVTFYGYKGAATYPLTSATENHYYKAEEAFQHSDVYGSTNYYLSMMLTAETLATAKSNVTRGIAADGSAPTGTIYLCTNPGDPNRNVRYRLLDNFDFVAQFFDDFPGYLIATTDRIVNRDDVFGYMLGRASLPDHLWTTNDYISGAMGDFLTSWSGRLPSPPTGQSSVWDWMRAGMSASYGTVVEPYNLLEKFPNPMNYYWSARGFNLAESYWMSVEHPYQGLFVGEPLCAPYAFPPTVQITSLITNQVVSGIVTMQVSAASNANGQTPKSIDLYVEDLFVTNLTTASGEAGNRLAVHVGTVTCTYDVVAGDSMYDAIDGLTYNINASNLEVWAYAYGDRLQLAYTNYGHFGSNVVYGATTLTGTAAGLSIHAKALTSNLLETIYYAREYITIEGTANTGDTVTCVITLTNGVAATNVIVAHQGEGASSVMGRLKDTINAHSNLQGSDGAWANPHSYNAVSLLPLEARKAGPEGHSLHVHFMVERDTPPSGLETTDWADHFNDNQDDMTARGTILFEAGTDPLTISYVLDTSSYPDGSLSLRAVAKLGTAAEVQGHYVLPIVVSNSALSCTITDPTNSQAFILGDSVTVSVTATHPIASVTQVVFFVEGKEAAVDTTAPYSLSWQTTNYGVGRVSIRANAYDASGNEAQSDSLEVDIRMSPTIDTDGDGVGDRWEQLHFGGIDVYGATDNPDGDAFDNYQEFTADTDPNDAGVFFSILNVLYDTNDEVTVSFLSRTSRQYSAEYNDNYHTDFTNWIVASPTSFWGTGGSQAWLDDGGETSTHPSSTLERLYRIQVEVP